MKTFLYWITLTFIFAFITLGILFLKLPFILKIFSLFISLGCTIYSGVNLGRSTVFLKENLKIEILKETTTKK